MIFWYMLLGHLIGDYIFQTQWMANNKKKCNWLGWITCWIHCVLYTFAICLMMWDFRLIWIFAVFMSHFWIDKFSLIGRWITLLRGRSIEKYLNTITGTYMFTNQHILNGAFTVFVYIAIDNTFHLLLMTLFYNLLKG